MIGKLIGVMFAISLLAFSLAFYYYNIPGDPKELFIQNMRLSPPVEIDYGPTPVFSENLRFNHNDLSFFINPSCSLPKKNAILEAFSIVQEKSEILSFYEDSLEESDIIVGCSEEYIELGDNLYVAGEGGPSEIVDTGSFNVIRKGKIALYDEPKCDYPVVAIHELLHVLGFDHSSDSENIMYNISNCKQRISSDILTTLKNLYSVPAYSDLTISNISAIKSGKYLDFNITIRNIGLLNSQNSSLAISSQNRSIDKIEIPEINFGAGISFQIKNMRLFSREIEEIEFLIEKSNRFTEMDYENNVVRIRE